MMEMKFILLLEFAVLQTLRLRRTVIYASLKPSPHLIDGRPVLSVPSREA